MRTICSDNIRTYRGDRSNPHSTSDKGQQDGECTLATDQSIHVWGVNYPSREYTHTGKLPTHAGKLPTHTGKLPAKVKYVVCMYGSASSTEPAGKHHIGLRWMIDRYDNRVISSLFRVRITNDKSL